jgi:hypothetical protein
MSTPRPDRFTPGKDLQGKYKINNINIFYSLIGKEGVCLTSFALVRYLSKPFVCQVVGSGTFVCTKRTAFRYSHTVVM